MASKSSAKKKPLTLLLFYYTKDGNVEILGAVEPAPIGFIDWARGYHSELSPLKTLYRLLASCLQIELPFGLQCRNLIRLFRSFSM